MDAIITMQTHDAYSAAAVRPIPKRARERIERMMRKHLAEWGLPMEEYDCKIEPGVHDVSAFATFTRRSTGLQIVVTDIYYDRRTGKVFQCGSNYGDLTY